MRWPWPPRWRRRDDDARRAKEAAERALREEQRRLVEARRLVRRLAAHRSDRDNLAEQMRIAFGGEPR